MGERMISTCVFPNVKHGGGGVMVWGCFTGDTVCDLFRIQGTLNQHGYHRILQRYASHLISAEWDYHLFLNRTMTQHTSRLCKGYLTKKDKLVDRMPRVWKAVKVATLKNPKYILICLTLFWLLHDSICIIS